MRNQYLPMNVRPHWRLIVSLKCPLVVGQCFVGFSKGCERIYLCYHHLTCAHDFIQLNLIKRYKKQNANDNQYHTRTNVTDDHYHK